MRHRVVGAFVVAWSLVAPACGGENAEPSDEPESSPDASAAAPTSSAPTRPELGLSPAAGPAGTQVTLTLSGLMMREPLDIGFGDMSQHVILGHAEADVDGNLSATVTIPADATPRAQFLFAQNSESGQVVSTPTVFVVTGADGKVTLSGRMSDEGVECAAMRGEAGELYTLTGSDDWPEPGTRVTVEGTMAEMSICQQGATIAVESIRAVP